MNYLIWECKDCTKEYSNQDKPAICTCGCRKLDIKREQFSNIPEKLKIVEPLEEERRDYFSQVK